MNTDRERQRQTERERKLRDIKHSLARFTGQETKVQIFRKHILPPLMKLSHIFGRRGHLKSLQRCSEILHFGHSHLRKSFSHKEKFCRIALDSCEI